MKTPSDEQLMLAVGAGDLNAFEQIVLRHQQSAWQIAYRFLGDRVTAEDIAQEAFLKILVAAERYRPTAKFRTYLHRVVTRLCLDTVRKKQPTYVDDIAAVSGSSPAPLEAMESRERDEAVRQALNTLPPKDPRRNKLPKTINGTLDFQGFKEGNPVTYFRAGPNQRMAVVLAYYEGLRGREIAAAMKVSPKAVERLLARARQALAVRLEDFLEK